MVRKSSKKCLMLQWLCYGANGRQKRGMYGHETYNLTDENIAVSTK